MIPVIALIFLFARKSEKSFNQLNHSLDFDFFDSSDCFDFPDYS
jgi:hypothetical protein